MTQPAAAEVPPTIIELLDKFTSQPGCEGYRGDAKRVDLLSLFLFVRQLTPSLTFEDFLTRFANFADADDENKKEPATAIKILLPRAKAKAEAAGKHQWSAKQVVDYVALYVDMVREAERTQTPVPLELPAFLGNEALIEQFLAGAFAAPKKTASRGRPRGSGNELVRPTQPQQRCIYNEGEGRQHRGYGLLG